MNNQESMNRTSEFEQEEMLRQPHQRAVAQMVASLPAEEPSLAWRSALSERIYQTAKSKERKRKLAWTLRPALGLGLGASLALAFLWSQPPVSPSSAPAASVEEQILSAHRDSERLEQFWGSVRGDEEVRQVSAPAVNEYQWDESDLGTL